MLRLPDFNYLQPGTLTQARTCGFHDHLNESDATWRGRIIVE